MFIDHFGLATRAHKIINSQSVGGNCLSPLIFMITLDIRACYTAKVVYQSYEIIHIYSENDLYLISKTTLTFVTRQHLTHKTIIACCN